MFTRDMNQKVKSAYVILNDSMEYNLNEYTRSIRAMEEILEHHLTMHSHVLEQFCYKYNISTSHNNYLAELGARIKFEDLQYFLSRVFNIDIEPTLMHILQVVETKTIQDYTACQQEFVKLMNDSTVFGYRMIDLRHVIMSLVNFSCRVGFHTTFMDIIRARINEIEVLPEKEQMKQNLLDKFATFITLMSENDKISYIERELGKITLTKDKFREIVNTYIHDIQMLKNMFNDVTREVKALTD